MLEGYISRFNIEHYLITCLPIADDPLDSIALANKWPKDWWNHYLENNFSEHDSVIRECFRGDQIIQRHENKPDYQGPHEDLEKTRQIGENASAFGSQRGFVVPIHRAHGFCELVSYAGNGLHLLEEDKPLLYLISKYAF